MNSQSSSSVPKNAAKEKAAEKKKDRHGAISKWKAIVEEYQKPNASRVSWQILDTVGGYAALWSLMYLSRSVS